VTLSLNQDGALAVPGYGLVATPAGDDWTHQQSEKADVYRSSRLIVTVGVNRPGKPIATEVDIAKFFKVPLHRPTFRSKLRGQDAVANDRMVHVRAQPQRQ
jgi:hypothetical protein